MPRTKAYNKEEVLEKAMNVFWTHGYSTTSVRFLEKEMGINQFSIYSTFLNKKNLFIEALRKYRDQAEEERFAPLLREGATISDLKLFLDGYIVAVREGKANNGCLVVNTTSEMIAGEDAEVAVELQEYFAFVKQMLRTILVNSIKSGQIDEDTDLEKYSNYLLGVMQSLSVIVKSMNERQIQDYIGIALRDF